MEAQPQLNNIAKFLDAIRENGRDTMKTDRRLRNWTQLRDFRVILEDRIEKFGEKAYPLTEKQWAWVIEIVKELKADFAADVAERKALLAILEAPVEAPSKTEESAPLTVVLPAGATILDEMNVREIGAAYRRGEITRFDALQKIEAICRRIENMIAKEAIEDLNLDFDLAEFDTLEG